MQLAFGKAAELRYRLVPGRTVRWVIRMDVDLTVETTGAPTETLRAMVTTALDIEVVRLEGQTALARAYPHRSDFWVKSGTLTEDDVADPMAGFVPAILLDDLGSVVPLTDQMATALAEPDDANPSRVLLLSLFPPYPEPEVETSMQWEVGLHPSWSHTEDIALACGFARLDREDGGVLRPVVLHGTAYEWSRPASEAHAFASSGEVKFAAETRVDPNDGWASHTEANAQIVARHARGDGAQITLTTTLKVIAERE